MKKTKDIPRAQRRWVNVNLSGARFHNVDLTGSRIRGALLVDVELDGLVERLTVNGVDVAAYVEQELDRRDPERALLRAADPRGLLDAWAALERRWAATTERARRLPGALLHQQVDGEWSFVETLRHLIFVTDAWFRRPVLGSRDYDPAGLAHDEMPPWFVEACGLDPKATPTATQVLDTRADRVAEVRSFLEALTVEELDRRCRRNPRPGYPTDTRKLDVRTCLRTVLQEEWLHHEYAARDLALVGST